MEARERAEAMMSERESATDWGDDGGEWEP